MNTKAGTPAHNNAYDVKIIETYLGAEISVELFELVAREDLTVRGIHLVKPERPYGVRIFDNDMGENVPDGVYSFSTLDSARAYFGKIR